MFNDLLHPAFIESNGEVAINTDEATGDNPLTGGGEMSDFLRKVMTADNKLRIVVAL